MRHPDEDAYALVSYPNALADVADCANRGRDIAVPDDLPLEYGGAYGASFHFRTENGETPVLRTLWVREEGEWKIAAYDIEEP